MNKNKRKSPLWAFKADEGLNAYLQSLQAQNINISALIRSLLNQHKEATK